MRRRCIPHGTFAGDTAGILACYVGSEWCRVSGVGPGCNRAFRFGCECSASATRPSSVSSSCNGSITRRHGHYRRMSTIYERRNNGHYRRTVPRTPCGQLRATVRNILRRDPLVAPVRTQLSLSRSRRPQRKRARSIAHSGCASCAGVGRRSNASRSAHRLCSALQQQALEREAASRARELGIRTFALLRESGTAQHTERVLADGTSTEASA
jgi:hypothetical protein